MKILFIVRSTLFTTRGGDTIQVEETARALRDAGVGVDIRLANEKINYHPYDLLHFFNITRPADMLVHIKRSKKPFVLSTIFIDFSIYDKQQRRGIAGKLFKLLSADGIEYAKTVYRFLARKDSLASISYLWKGQRKSIQGILHLAKCVLVQAEKEYTDIVRWYKIAPPFALVQNGVNAELFRHPGEAKRKENLVICVARVEGIKNQHNLIRALNDSEYELVLIGDAAPNQQDYYEQCRKMAADNVSFVGHLRQEQLVHYYAAAKVHVLPSWFEVCGLSSLEAAAMGCGVVITNYGYAASYFREDAFYCDPADPGSILTAVRKAMAAKTNGRLQDRVSENFTWPKAAEKTMSVYKKYTA